MPSLSDLLARIPVDMLVRIASVGIPLLIILLLGNIALSVFERAAIRHATKRGLAVRARYAVRILRYVLVTLLIVIGAFSVAGSWTGLGVSLGVIAAAAGFALQRPAASVAAWFAILVKKPFLIGDRIAVGTIARGDVIDLTLTHIMLAEVGRWGTEDVSGRTIMVPNNVIFEMPVTRYGDADDRILGEVEFIITYESNLVRARELAEAIANERAGGDAHAHTRIKLMENGVQLQVRFDVEVAQSNRISSEISEDILTAYRAEDEVSLAYTRMEVKMVDA